MSLARRPSPSSSSRAPSAVGWCLSVFLATLVAILSGGCSRSLLGDVPEGGGGGGGSEPCGPDTCAQGCCDDEGECVLGNAQTACGTSGAACIDCNAQGLVCQPETQQCGAVCECGNDVCQPQCGENGGTCSQDCLECPPGAFCGDGKCSIECNEDQATCPQDCGACPPNVFCGDGVCQPE